MDRCSCGSFAINHHTHGRDGSNPELCDVCYWRTRADRYRDALNNIRTQISAGTPTDLVWRLADNALRGGEE